MNKRSQFGGQPNKVQRSWAEDAAWLLTIDATGEWRKTHRSFSLFLGDLARQRREARSSLWRRVAAGEYYESLRRDLDPKGALYPPLTSGSVYVSPESLELLRKLSRIAPRDLLTKIQRGAIAGRSHEGNFAICGKLTGPYLAGRTARGRGERPTPEYDANDGVMRRARAEADALTPIVRGGAEWLGGRTGACLPRHSHPREC